MAPSIDTTPLIGQGLPLKEPKLHDVLLAWKTKLLVNLHCIKVGEIVSYTYPTATVQILGQRVMKNGTTSPYPKLQNVPVFTLQGGGYSVQLPIQAGDQCLVFFADRNIDAWFQNGNSQPPLDGRLHDISDGFAIVGVNWKNSHLLPNPTPNEAGLYDPLGTTKVALSGGKITVQNPAENLGTILSNITIALQTLNSAIAAMTTASIAAGTPQAVAAGQAANIALYILDLAALLY